MLKNRLPVLLLILTAVLATFLLAGRATGAAEVPDAGVIYRGVQQVVAFDVSPRLDSLKPADLDVHAFFEILDEFRTGNEGPYGPQTPDQALQTEVGDGLSLIPGVSFNTLPNVAGFTPPDPNGDVGPNHVVVMSNVHFAVYSKTGTQLLAPIPNNTLWAGFGGDCQTDNSGDPVVLYDQLADRWLLSQFTASGPTYFNCIALSTSGDPTGTYFRWAVSTGANFPDYPKYGVWPNAYFISTREFGPVSFAGAGAYALNKAEMIAGDPTPTIISFLVPPGGTPYLPGDGLLPADLDGTTLPPSNNPHYFVGSMDDGGPYSAPDDALTLWHFNVDFVTPANSSFVLDSTIPILNYDTIYPCSPGSRACIPQPGTTVKVDILSYRQRPIFRLAYRNFGTHESLVTNQSVEASAGMSGNRWWEIRNPAGTPVLFQEGTYAPGITDGIHRWMASVAMDQDGNMAMGYSVSSSTVFPGIRYTGRLAGDPLGTMPQGEGTIVTGTGSQTSSGNRWGDYTSLVVDPVDDCTFWYTNQWIPTTSTAGWVLRVGSFKFDTCGDGGTPTPTPTGPTPTNTATPTATNTQPGPTATFTPTPRRTATPGGPTSTPTNTPAGPTLTPTPSNTPGAGTQTHVADLDGTSVPASPTRWNATVTIKVVDQNGAAVSGATVSGTWSNGASGNGNCVTNASGLCSITKVQIRTTTNSVTFTVTNISKAGTTYNAAANTDPDGDSNGTVIVVNKP